jgi:hypothetical protein
MNARGEISWTSLDEYESIANQQNEVFKYCSKEKALECIKALSRIEGATMSMGGLTNREVFIQDIDVVMKYFEELLKELDG